MYSSHCRLSQHSEVFVCRLKRVRNCMLKTPVLPEPNFVLKIQFYLDTRSDIGPSLTVAVAQVPVCNVSVNQKYSSLSLYYSRVYTVSQRGPTLLFAVTVTCLHQNAYLQQMTEWDVFCETVYVVYLSCLCRLVNTEVVQNGPRDDLWPR